MPREDGASTSAQLLTSQAKNVTIALAVLSIYAVDFAINVGMYLIRLLGVYWLFTDRRSASVLSELGCRHSANPSATGRISMGYVSARRLLYLPWIVLRSWSWQNGSYWTSHGLCDRLH